MTPEALIAMWDDLGQRGWRVDFLSMIAYRLRDDGAVDFLSHIQVAGDTRDEALKQAEKRARQWEALRSLATPEREER